MRKNLKRMLACMLAVVMVLCAVPMSANVFTAEAIGIPSDAVEFNGHYYKVYDQPLNWRQAESYCEKRGGHLVTITSKEENEHILSLIIGSTYLNYFIGFTDEKEEGKWEWVTGEKITYQNWGVNLKGNPHPDNDSSLGGQDYAAILSDKTTWCGDAGKWDDVTSVIVEGCVWPFICEWEPNYSSKATDYIQQHIDFTNSSKYSNLLSNGSFYNSIWKYESTDKNFTAMTAWKVLGDIGDAMSLNFKDVLITENPYDMILADILSSYVADNTIVEASEKILEIVFDVDDAYNDIIKTLQTSEEWDKTADTSELKDTLDIILGKSKEGLIDGVFFSKKEYDIAEKHPGAYSYLSKLIPKIPQDKWNDIFKGIDNVSTVLGYINTASDVVYSFIDAYQKYVVAKALVTTQTNALSSLMLAGYYMPPIAQKLLQESINSYLEVLNYDSGFNSVCNYALGDSIQNVYNVFRGSLTKLVYNLIGNVFNIKDIGTIGTLVFTYNTTYALLDYFSGLGDRSELFFLLDAAAYLEQGMIETVNIHADTLNDKKTLDWAERFDSAWGLLQALEQYEFGGLGEYISAIKRYYGFETTLKTALSGNNYFYVASELKKLHSNLSNADAGIKAAEYFDGEWKNSSCHDKNSSQSKVVSVKCPTDVYVYDENNNLALSIVSNEITKLDAQIAAIVDGDEKTFAIPDDQNYSIKIVGTDNGIMNYSICDIESMTPISVSEYQNIELTPKCIYTGSLNIVAENEETDYELSLDYYEPPHEHSYTPETVSPTCTEDGKTVYTCSCGDTYTEVLPATGHTDENADGKCDICGETLEAVKNCTHLCHKTGFLGFIWKIVNLFNILFRINPACSCGMKHY